jgi:PiT family inorganic phosphate transporter
MLILIAFMPAKFAINHSVSDTTILAALNQTELVVKHNKALGSDIAELDAAVAEAKQQLPGKSQNAFKFRKQIQTIKHEIDDIAKVEKSKLSADNLKILHTESEKLDKVTDFAPIWVIAVISISLGVGTMIGWKRIVVTIGEKIGNEHLNYAQGASAEIVAASTIGLSTAFGLPVSTTHVLSSGIAGAMVASGGKGNLNNNTLKNIAIAWVLTLPVAITLAILLFMLFHLFI